MAGSEPRAERRRLQVSATRRTHGLPQRAASGDVEVEGVSEGTNVEKGHKIKIRSEPLRIYGVHVMAANSQFDSIEGRSSALRGIYAALEREVRTETFEDRLRIQKEVYMMRLHPDLEPHLPFDFNMYVRGPYSPDLAKAYYTDAQPVHVDLTRRAADYAREILGMDTQMLEAMATLVEICNMNSGNPGFTIEDGLRMLVSIKPSLEKIASEALNTLGSLRKKYELKLPDACTRSADSR